MSFTAIEASFFCFNGYALADWLQIRIDFSFDWPQVTSLAAFIGISHLKIKIQYYELEFSQSLNFEVC